ncbi:hypothetical protein [Antarctobacter heliothermus]|nr:hypothetical protein [Antarctobacter heliothermus]
MTQNEPVRTGRLVRIPGLYRRWELSAILKNHCVYRIEKAGAHQDGTPLVAVYADHRDHQEKTASHDNTAPASVPAGTMLRRPE